MVSAACVDEIDGIEKNLNYKKSTIRGATTAEKEEIQRRKRESPTH
jgi:hypothetical protein